VKELDFQLHQISRLQWVRNTAEKGEAEFLQKNKKKIEKKKKKSPSLKNVFFFFSSSPQSMRSLLLVWTKTTPSQLRMEWSTRAG
jgi:hypothetical protein